MAHSLLIMSGGHTVLVSGRVTTVLDKIRESTDGWCQLTRVRKNINADSGYELDRTVVVNIDHVTQVVPHYSTAAPKEDLS